MQLEITYSKDNTHVENSYLLKTKKAIAEEVSVIIFVRDARMLPVTRTESSYIREWKAHNNLYRLGLFKDHTKDVDLEENIKWWKEIIWFIIGR